jgi:RNA polymerase sigma-70 factor, ECF subfamily
VLSLMALGRRLDPERLVEHLPRLHRAARAWCGSREAAEDLVQEMCARVLSRPRFVRGEDELGYLLRALRNTLVSQQRAAHRRPVAAPLNEELAASTSAAFDPERAAELHELHAALAELPAVFRDAFVAVDIAGLSYREAARALRVREGTLTSRLFRARERLGRRLAEPRTDAATVPRKRPPGQ